MALKFSNYAPPESHIPAGSTAQPYPVAKRLKKDRITLEVLEAHFHLPLAVAAQHLDVSETYLKTRCRAEGIYRWRDARKATKRRGFDSDIAGEEEVDLRGAQQAEQPSHYTFMVPQGYQVPANEPLQTPYTNASSAPEGLPQSQQPEWGSVHQQVSSNVSAFSSAATILKRAAEGWSFTIVELWLPAIDKTQLLFDADTCAISPGAPQTAMSAFREFSKRVTFRKGDGIPGRVWETLKPELRSNVQGLSDDLFHRKSVSIATGLKGVVAWPVISAGILLGVLCAFYDHPLNRAEEIDDVKQIQNVSQLLARALSEESELHGALGLFASECQDPSPETVMNNWE